MSSDEAESGVYKSGRVVADHDLMGDKANVTHSEAAHIGELTPEELIIEKKLKRRIDSLIMPLIILVYLLNYIDRNNYAAARLQGLEKDLGLKGDDYQLGVSILFVSYILGQVPSNLLLNHLGRPSLYLGGFTIAWGLVSALTSQVKSAGGIIACRFVLGLVESPFFAGVLYYLSKWYTKSEINLRMSIFYSGSLISGAFGNLIAAGILNGLNGKRGIAAWQWLYIIEGTITIFVGIVICFVLPDFPDTWRLLDPQMKHVANRRLAIDAAEADVDEPGAASQIRGLKAAFTDIKVYLLALLYMCQTGAAGFQFFFPTLTKTLGYGQIVSLLLVAPPYVFMTIYSYIHGIASDRLNKRFWEASPCKVTSNIQLTIFRFCVYPIPITIAGFLIFMFTDSFGARYVSFFLMVFIFAMNGTIYAWIANAIPRPPAKRAAAFAFINAFGNSASIWTPFTYRDQDKPHYRPALGINIGLLGVGFLAALAIKIILERENKRLDRMENEDAVLSESDLARLQKTAEFEGIDIAAARRLQKGYRYVI